LLLLLLYLRLLGGDLTGDLLGDLDNDPDLDLDLDLDFECDLDLDLDLEEPSSWSFNFLAFCLALKNSYKPSFSHPSL
jgi:hypothetical protein